MGGEGGGVGGEEVRGPSWRGRIRGVQGENKRGGAGSRAQPPPTSPRNGYTRIQNIMHGAV